MPPSRSLRAEAEAIFAPALERRAACRSSRCAASAVRSRRATTASPSWSGCATRTSACSNGKAAPRSSSARSAELARLTRALDEQRIDVPHRARDRQLERRVPAVGAARGRHRARHQDRLSRDHRRRRARPHRRSRPAHLARAAADRYQQPRSRAWSAHAGARDPGRRQRRPAAADLSAARREDRAAARRS